MLGDASNGVIKTLRDLQAHLNANNIGAISQDLGAVDTVHEAVVTARTDVGARTNRLDAAQSRLGQLEETTTTLLSNTEDADMAKTLIDASTQQAVYQSALRAGAPDRPDVPARFPALNMKEARMQISSTRFGEVEVRDDAVLEFPDGLIGLPGTRYALLGDAPDSPFFWLHSVDHDDVAVPVTNPWLFFDSYEVRVSDEDAARLELIDPADADILCVVRATGAARGLLRQPRRAGRAAHEQAARPSDHQRRAWVRCPRASLRRGGAGRCPGNHPSRPGGCPGEVGREGPCW